MRFHLVPRTRAHPDPSSLSYTHLSSDSASLSIFTHPLTFHRTLPPPSTPPSAPPTFFTPIPFLPLCHTIITLIRPANWIPTHPHISNGAWSTHWALIFLLDGMECMLNAKEDCALNGRQSTANRISMDECWRRRLRGKGGGCGEQL